MRHSPVVSSCRATVQSPVPICIRVGLVPQSGTSRVSVARCDGVSSDLHAVGSIAASTHRIGTK